MTTTTRTRSFSIWGALFALLAGFVASAPAAAADLAYGYFRTLDGYANLIQAASDSRVDLEANYPVLAGDRVELPPRSRVEAVLADDTYVRIGGDTELVFDRLALSGDTEDDTTLLRLLYGEIQLEVHRDGDLGIEPLRVDTVNATIYMPRSGSFRIASDGNDWTEVVARDGYAEVTTQRGSALVRTDEQVTVLGDRWARVTVEAAAPRNALERWGDDLLLAARSGYSDDVEPRLGYAAASLSSHGGWVDVGGRRAWRPRVSVGWRPYHDGWWHYTPSGLTWVSREPWGWVTYHYGFWDYADPWGWVWYPGYAYTPAAVYWYWGPSYVAWVPYGYYYSYYRHYPWRFGVYGWAGGYSGVWTTWTFCPTYAFGRRDTRVFYRSGAELTRRGELRDLERGIITTDTRPLTPDRWKSHSEAHAALKAAAVRQGKLGAAGSLPDVSDFVARKRELSSDTARAISAAKGDPVLGRTPVTRVRDSHGGEVKRDAIAGSGRGGSGRPGDLADKRPSGDSGAIARGRTGDSGKDGSGRGTYDRGDSGKDTSGRGAYDRGDYGKSDYGRGAPGRGDYGKDSSGRGAYDRGDYGKGDSGRGSYDRGDSGKSDSGREAPDRGDYGKSGSDRGSYDRGDSGKSDSGRGANDRGDSRKGDSGRGADDRGDSRKGDSGRGADDRGDSRKGDSGGGVYDRGDYGKGSADRSTGAGGKTDVGSWRDRAVLNRPPSGSGSAGKTWERGSSFTPRSSGEAPPVRRVLEGVRDYRERSRTESGSSSSRGYSRPSGGEDRGGSARSGSSGSYRKPSSSSSSSRSGSSARSSGSSGSKSSARSSDSGRSRSNASSSRSGGSRSGGSRAKPSGGSSGGAKRRGG